MVFGFGLRRLVTAIALILAVCGCASERVMEKAQGEAEYFPVGSVPIQVTGASRDARYLYVCVVATNPDGWRHSYTIKTDASGANLAPQADMAAGDELPVVKVNRLFSGCHQSATKVAVIRHLQEGRMTLPDGVDEAVFAVAEGKQWSLRYLSNQMVVPGHDRYAIDLSGSAIFRHYVDGSPLMWALVPVATAVDAAAVMTMGMLAIACGDNLCDEAMDPYTKGQNSGPY